MTYQAAQVLEVGMPDAWNEGRSYSSTLPPIAPCAHHTLLTCGGYVRCVRCCGVSDFSGSSKLTKDCVGGCPLGSRRPLKRLAQGVRPRPLANGTGCSWPSGELAPPRLCTLIARPTLIGLTFFVHALECSWPAAAC